MEITFFLTLSIVAVTAAAGAIISRNTVHSALLMVVTLFSVAVLYLSLSAEFLAVVQITVYAGAIMVLFLFVITMLNPSREEGPNRLRNRLPVSIGLGVAFLVGLILVLQPQLLRVAAPPAGGTQAPGNLEALGGAIFTQYLLPFELTSLLLLVGMIAAMVLGRRRA